MKAMTDFASAYGSRMMAALRVAGFLTLVVVLTPVHIVYRVLRPEDKFRLPQFFHRLLIALLGFRVRAHGTVASASPVLFVANHASYLDILVLATLIPAAFVAKSEVANWPLIGFLAKLQNTVFIERRAAKAHHQKSVLHEKLAAGQSLIVFPEGTSTEGLGALPFKSSLFSVIEDNAKLTVQPISITCTELDGIPMTRELRSFYSWYGDMTLLPHLWNVFKLGGFTLDVVFHSPVTANNFADRKELARYCHQQVARGIEQCLKGRNLSLPGEMLQLPVLA